MLSTPDLRQRAAAIAPCLPLAGGLAPAQTRRQRQQPNALLPVNARRNAQQTLPAAAPEGGCYGSRVFVTNELIATNKHVVGCGGRRTVNLACQRRSFPITVRSSDPQHDLTPVRVISANAQPLALSTQGLPAPVRITVECPVAKDRR